MPLPSCIFQHSRQLVGGALSVKLSRSGRRAFRRPPAKRRWQAPGESPPSSDRVSRLGECPALGGATRLPRRLLTSPHDDRGSSDTGGAWGTRLTASPP